MTSALGVCKGVIGTLSLIITAFFGSVFLMGPVLPLMFFSPSLFRWVTDYLMSMWLLLPVALMEIVFGVTVSMTGDTVAANEGSIIIMNHRTRLDWMFFWLVLHRQSNLRTEKIILKSDPKFMPGFGWAMQIACYIFLRRRWDTDKPWLSALLEYYGLLRYKGQFLIFPEGTNFDMKTKESSNKFAKKSNRPEYNYCLHPRTTGFVFLTQELRQKNLLDSLYDVTVTYPDTIPELGEFNFIFGSLPSKVGFHIRKHSNSSLPSTKENLESWCVERWQEKETALEAFYTGDKSRLLLPGCEGDGLPKACQESEGSRRMILYMALVSWMLFLVAVVWLLMNSSVAWCFLVIVPCFCTYQLVVNGGVESIIMSSCRRYYG
ncbi:lysocardiolipin acyltransferase 1-like [Asterias amurensis]|uniref:lysocardiolipin acyltransferase 1-like n=1 Tax=Asterias amurensis TaxID=7602 RepID=UPI003AB8481B